MPKGYWVARVDVTDPEGYQAYVAANAAAFRKVAARSSPFVAGVSRHRKASPGRAMSCWSSRTMKLRWPATTPLNTLRRRRCGTAGRRRICSS